MKVELRVKVDIDNSDKEEITKVYGKIISMVYNEISYQIPDMISIEVICDDMQF